MQIIKSTPQPYITITMSLNEASSVAHNLNEWYTISCRDDDHQENLRHCLDITESEYGWVFLTELEKELNAKSDTLR